MAAYLEEAVASVINQSFRDWECIMVNDGSTDNSEEIANRTITLISPSKTFNIPGLKFSIAVARNREIWRALRNQLDNYPADVLGIVAATAAFRDCENWKEQMLAYLQKKIEPTFTII